MLPPGFLDAARKLVGAKTVSHLGTEAAADLLAPLYESAGLSVQRQVVEEAGVRHVNIVAGPGGAAAAAGGVLLVTHLDTVPEGPTARWTETFGDPWALTEKNGWLFGLGCADVKLDALCKIEAARRLRGRKLSRPFWLMGTFGEEVGLRGARHFAQSELFRTLAPRWVLCGEPSELQLIHAHKGYAVVRCTLRDAQAPTVPASQPREEELVGKAAHSSTPHLGQNAISLALARLAQEPAPLLGIQGGAAANVVPARCTLLRGAAQAGRDLRRAALLAQELSQLWLSILGELEPTRDDRFDPPGAVGGLNVIQSAPSGEPALDATFDARLLPQHDPEELLRRFAERAQARVRALPGMSLSISVERNASGMALPDDSPLVLAMGKALRAQGLPEKPRAKPTSTEAGVFARAGCEAVVIGPGVSTGNAHTANERIELTQLERAIDLYERVLLVLCGG